MVPKHAPTVLLAAAALLAAEPAAAAPTSCPTPREQSAAKVRQLQTELMVAALTCANHPTASHTQRYNSFIRKFSSNLVDNADVLRGYFSRAYGKSQGRQFDAYITAMANEASLRVMGVAGFCEAMEPIFEKVLGLSGRDLERFAEQRDSPSSFAACKTP